MSINRSSVEKVDADDKVTGIYVEYNGSQIKSIKLLYDGEKPEKCLYRHPNSIGVYFTPAPAAKKLEGCGDIGGTSWDDGVFDGVRKAYVGQNELGIVAVKFTYTQGDEVVQGDQHGERTLMGIDEFELDYPSEYIIAVDGKYDKLHGNKAPFITMLRFTTNKRQSDAFGFDAGIAFTLKEEGHKIVGFHGMTGEQLHKLGVYFLPINN